MWSEEGYIEKEEALTSLRDFIELLADLHSKTFKLGQALYEDRDPWYVNERAEEVAEIKSQVAMAFALPYYDKEGNLSTFASSFPYSPN